MVFIVIYSSATQTFVDESPGDLDKNADSNSIGLGAGLQFCISNKLR